MDGWVDGQMNYRDQAGALWGTLEKESRPHKGGCTCWEYMLVNKFTRNTERHPEKQFVYVCECTCMCEWFVISALGAKRKKNPTEQKLPTAPAARGNTIMRVLVSIFWLWKLCWKVEKCSSHITSYYIEE